MLRRRIVIPLVVLAVAAACDQAMDGPVALDTGAELQVRSSGDQASVSSRGEWSEPVHLASTASDRNDVAASLSADGRTLYFASQRRGGPFDIYVARRPCAVCEFGPPEPLPAPINSPTGDAGPFISLDGRLFFFNSQRDGSQDIFVSRWEGGRHGAWGEPMKLGAAINSAGNENHAHYLVRPGEAYTAPGSHGVLYFSRDDGEIYAIGLDRDLEPVGEPVAVAELNHPDFHEGAPSLTANGLQVFFHSPRVGSQPPDAERPSFDVWTATRRTVRERWSAPVNLGPVVNGLLEDFQPGISFDGRTLIFTSLRDENLGGWDLWMTTRTGG